MKEIHVFIKFDHGVCTVFGPDGMHVELWPGSEAHLKFSCYEKKKEKK